SIFPVTIQSHHARVALFDRVAQRGSRGRAQSSLLHAEEGSNPDARQEPWLGRTIGTAPIRDHDVGETGKLLHAAKLTLQPLPFIPRNYRDAVSGPPAPKLEAVTRYRSRNGIASPFGSGRVVGLSALLIRSPAPQVDRSLARPRHPRLAYSSPPPSSVTAARRRARRERPGPSPLPVLGRAHATETQPSMSLEAQPVSIFGRHVQTR